MTVGLNAESIAAALTPGTFVTEVEHFPIALTTEALALGWLRQRNARHGALVVADGEISARTRSDERIDESAVHASVILRTDIAADHQDVQLAAGLLAGADGCSVLDDAAGPWWPEFVFSGQDRLGAVRVETQLSSGRAVSSVLTFRLGFGHRRDAVLALEMLEAAMTSLGRLLQLPPAELAGAYRDRCSLYGRPIRINLRPRGTSGGVAASIDERGAFGVSATSGSVARYGVDQIRSIDARD